MTAVPNASETFYQSIVEHQTELICRYDTDFRLTFVNRAYCDWCDTSREALLGTTLLDRIPPEDRARAIAHVRALTTESSVTVSIHRSILADGTLRVIEWTDRALFDEDGRVVEYQGVGRDVTEREQHLQQLRAATDALGAYHEHFDSLLKTMQDALMSISYPDRKIIFASAAFERVFGYPPQAFIEDPELSRRVVHPDDLEHTTAAMQTCLREGFVETEHRIILPDGKVRWIHRRAWVHYDADGRPLRINDSGRDITVQKLTQNMLRRSEEMHRLILTSISDAVFVTDEEGKFTFICPNVHILFGYTEWEVARLGNIAALLGGDLFDPDALKRAGEIANIERTIQDKFGQEHVVLITVKHADLMHGTHLYSCRDITGRKHAEEALVQSESRYHQMFELHGLPKLIVDPLDGRILDANPAAGRFYGQPVEALQAQTIFDLNLSPRVDVEAKMARALTSDMLSCEFVHRGAEGLPHDVEVFTGPVEIEGRTVLYSTVTDVTEKKRAAADLEESRDLLEQRVLDRTKELERTKNRIEAIFNHSGDGILLLDAERGIQQANYAFDEMFRVPIDSYIGRHLKDFFYSPDPLLGAADLDTMVAQVSATHQTCRVEARAVRADGTDFDAEISIAPVNRSDQLITNLVCIIRDVSERARSQNALRLSEERLNMMLEGTRAGTWEWFVQSGETRFNERWAQITGYTLEELAPVSIQTWANLAHPDDLAHSNALLESHFAGESAYYDCEARMRHKDGRWVWVWDRGMVMDWDSDGKPLRMLGTHVDITDRKQTELAVAEERNLLRTLIDAVPDFIYVKDRQHRMVLNNAAHAHSLGARDPADVVGLTDDQMFPPALAAKFRADEEWLFETGQAVINTEERSLGKEGREIWALTTKVPLRSLQGELIGLVGITHDVSALKASEEALRRSERQYRESQAMLRLVLDTIPARVFWKDRNSALMGGNRLFAQDMGFASIEDLIGKATSEVANTEDEADSFRADDLAVIETGIPKLDYEEKYTRPDGVVLTVQSSKLPLRDDSGAIIGVLGTYFDVTERKQAERAVKESEEKFRLFIESAPIPTVISELNGRIVLVNRAAEKAYGYTRDELIGQDVTLLVPEERREHHEAHRHAYTDDDSLRSLGALEVYALRKDGSQFPVELQLSFVNVEPAPMTMAFVLDISQRKQAETALKQALDHEKELGELKSRFVSMASHEFRTPLTTILAATETLTIYRSRMTDPQIDARLDKIRQQVTHMKDIMEDVLQLARIQAGRVEFHPAPGDLDALCQEVIEEFESQSASHQGRVHYVVHPAPPLLLDYDSRLMRQIISNLLSNALKYSPEESVVHIALTKAGGEVRLTVSDAGIGIPPEDLKHLFEPFHRAANVGTISGTGLGLSIARQSVELHGGTITAESQVNVGTTFIVRIPSAS